MRYDIFKTEKINQYQVMILINGRPLLDIVKEQEIPHSRKEFFERKQNRKEDLKDDPNFLAGNYKYLNPKDIYLPSRNLLDEPFKIGFMIDDWDPILLKSTLLYCSCGNPDCWLFMCKISVRDNVIIWSDFEQYHRDWVYDMGPYIFEKEQYIEQLKET